MTPAIEYALPMEEQAQHAPPLAQSLCAQAYLQCLRHLCNVQERFIRREATQEEFKQAAAEAHWRYVEWVFDCKRRQEVK